MSLPDPSAVVLDTNVFVGAGFRPESSSAEIVRAVREGRLRMPWTEATREEIESVLRRIPPLSWTDVKELFRGAGRVAEDPDPRDEAHPSGEDPTPIDVSWIPDPSDRQFAALAKRTGAVLVSSDRHLLEGRERADVPIRTPGEFRETLTRDASGRSPSSGSSGSDR